MVDEDCRGWVVNWEMGVKAGLYYGTALLDFGGMKECQCTELVDADGRPAIVDVVDMQCLRRVG